MFEEKVIPLDIWISNGINWLVDNHRDIFMQLKWPVEQTLIAIDSGLNALHPLIVIAAIALLAWRLSGVRVSVF